MDEERDWRRELRDRGGETERPDPHHELANPAVDPDPTEWPDPYDKREDPRDEPDGEGRRRAEPGAVSTSEPHPQQDPQAVGAEPEEREHRTHR
jgi:hypothetical protein